MVPGLSPVIELVKLQAPVPSVVWLWLVVGFSEVLQQTPLAVTEAPPSELTFPPLEALLVVIKDTAVVVTAGAAVCAPSWITVKMSPAMVMFPVLEFVLELVETE